VATPPNPARQNARQFFVFDGFKGVLSVIKCQEFMPDPSDSHPWQVFSIGVNEISGFKIIFL
jgi:hypothetical protein